MVEREKLNYYRSLSKEYYYSHGLDLLPSDSINKYISGTLALDLGALNGGSALTLAKKPFSKILSFEISDLNCKKTRDAFKLAKVNNCELHQVALSDQKGTVEFSDTGTGSTNIYASNNQSVKLVKVGKDTLDNFITNHKGRIGFIKADIEGEEIPFLKGAKETIKRDRPILSMSIYHHAEQFFETKALIEDLDLNYKFMFFPIDSGHIINSKNYISWCPVAEATLIAWPAELGDHL